MGVSQTEEEKRKTVHKAMVVEQDQAYLIIYHDTTPEDEAIKLLQLWWEYKGDNLKYDAEIIRIRSKKEIADFLEAMAEVSQWVKS